MDSRRTNITEDMRYEKSGNKLELLSFCSSAVSKISKTEGNILTTADKVEAF
jgi:hypothetical protein